MFKKNPILKYESAMEEYPNTVFPAKKFIPGWYKKIPQWGNSTTFNLQQGSKKTVKQCMPFLDAFTTGYIITLPYDLYIKDHNGSPSLTWSKGVKNFPGVRDEPADINLVPMGHAPMEYVWNHCTSFQLPKGYSALCTHPVNRFDLPFTTISGVIDGDMITDPHGNYPFYIKQGFEGIIPQGTPIVQIIPFRQENWKSQLTPGLSKLGLMNATKTMIVFIGWYKKTFWSLKNYE